MCNKEEIVSYGLPLALSAPLLISLTQHILSPGPQEPGTDRRTAE
jgi:hypothetical protein